MKSATLATFKTLAALAALTTTSYAATVVGFTAGEGYSDGNLNDNPDWATDGAVPPDFDGPVPPNVWQVNSTVGTVTSTSSDATSAARFLTAAPSQTGQYFTFDFSFTAGTFQPGSLTNVVRMMVNRNVAFNSGVIVTLAQLGNSPDNFSLGFFENSGPNSSTGIGTFSGVDNVGFTLNEAENGYENNVSDRLRLTMTNIYSGAGNIWNTNAVLFNVDNNEEIVSGDFAWEAASNFTNQDKVLRFDNLGLVGFDDAGATSVTIHEVAIIPEPSAFGFTAAALALGLIRRRR